MDLPNEGAELITKMRKAMLDFERRCGKPSHAPIELTQAQYSQLKAECVNVFDMPEGQELRSFYGVPLVIKTELPYMGEKEDERIPPPAPRAGTAPARIRELDE